jgi:hypothetical protein
MQHDAHTPLPGFAEATGRDLCTCIREGHGQCVCKLALRADLPGATVCALVP